jgi:NAD(P)-dependent dehydrogenase (short-subunit alcohol dehydrogenase family)
VNRVDFGTQSGQVANQARIFGLGDEVLARLKAVYMVATFSGGAFGSQVGTASWGLREWQGAACLPVFSFSSPPLSSWPYRCSAGAHPRRRHSMTDIPYKTALIVGAGPGISASLARALTTQGLKVALAARNVAKLEGLAAETGAKLFECDASRHEAVEALFRSVDNAVGEPDLVVYNASRRFPGPVKDLDASGVRAALDVSLLGAFYTVKEAASRMEPRGKGAILLTGATASIKGFAHSAAFAMGKFGLRGLAQSTARELGPKGIHVAHFIIDGMVRSDTRPDAGDDSHLHPDDVAASYLDVLRQRRSAWSFEVELRPWLESF